MWGALHISFKWRVWGGGVTRTNSCRNTYSMITHHNYNNGIIWYLFNNILFNKTTHMPPMIVFYFICHLWLFSISYATYDCFLFHMPPMIVSISYATYDCFLFHMPPMIVFYFICHLWLFSIIDMKTSIKDFQYFHIF